MAKKRTPELEAAILDGVAQGITLTKLCKKHGIGYTTPYGWMRDEDFAGRMAWARAVGYDALCDQMLDIADDATSDWAEPDKRDVPPGETETSAARARMRESVARSRLRVETRWRTLLQWSPKRLADNLTNLGGVGGMAGMIGVAGGKDGGAIRMMDPTAIAARLSSLIALIDAREAADGDDGMTGHDGVVIENDDAGD